MKPAGSLVAFVVLALQAPCIQARVELAPCKNNYSPQQQIQLGQKAATQVYRQMPVLPDSSPATQYIEQLGNKLTSYAPGYKWPYNFHVVNSAEINAFALPGGSVFVNLGTIQVAADEAQLAGVMAHEISHVVLQHSVCNAEKQQKVGLIAGLGQIAAGVVLGGAAGEIAAQGIGMTAGLGFLKMSRAAERQADLEGVGILYDAGYDPHGLPQFFETMQAKYGSGGAQFLSDHPNPGDRTEYADKEIATFVPRSNYVTTTVDFQRIKAQVANMHAYTARELSSGLWKTQGPSRQVNTGVNESVTENAPGPDVNTASAWKEFRGSGFTLMIPGNWTAYGNSVAVMFAAPGGFSRSPDGRAGNVIYGMLTDRYQPEQNVPADAALDELIREITRDNPGLQSGAQTTITVNGVQARSLECENPSGNNGTGEHDWTIAFPLRDGSLRYFVFVAPSADFARWRPTFQSILQSLRFQS